MTIEVATYERNGLQYVIRPAEQRDALQLVDLRLTIDGETENMDRERGEGYLDQEMFEGLIESDTKSSNNLFLVAETDGRLVGFSRCQGSELKRLAHQVEFGVGVIQEFWGFGIGKGLLTESLEWADATGIEKVRLSVLETNEKAKQLYERLGFNVEGILRKDKRLSDGTYHDTVLMARFRKEG
ncbi:GNAT family N-acetyltransferase [Exiguobacterium flavidum]|uniref:GNAT family N-acetyltransferase n=1 Tax=Exiguobacterium flavidum TaxID=2184695 RepID=UPI000DF77FF9|nr:GNAT family N-acetyltransferase [Exiguobacterium flavidum]